LIDPGAIAERADRLGKRAVFLIVFLPLLLVYLATAKHDDDLYHGDAFTNTVAAWNLGSRGTVYLEDAADLAEPDYYGNVGWFVRSDRGEVVSQYPPGAALLAAPFYSVFDDAEVRTVVGSNNPDAPPISIVIPAHAPSSFAASFATAMAAGFVALAVVGLAGNRQAILTGWLGGLGTSAWSVASDQLWQHGPGMLWIALGILLASRNRHLPAGFAFGLAVLTRPHTAFIAAATGIGISLGKKSLRPAVSIGLGSTVGLAALLAFNHAVFGAVSISGGYGTAFTDQVVESEGSWFLGNVVGALFDPTRGLLIWAPFLLVLLPGLRRAWKSGPAWAKGAAVGGLLYLLIQLKANRFSGGDGFFAYRYPLEALTAAAPLFVLSYRAWVAESSVRLRLFRGAATLAIVAQAIGAMLN
jgi:alpha-1,2-mannosyltransferase